MTNLTKRVSTRQSLLYETNTGIIRRGSDVVVVDPGVLPFELDQLARDLDGQCIVAGFTTHAHWDHVLWADALGAEVPRYASENTVVQFEIVRERIIQQLGEIEEQAAAEGASGTWNRDLLFREYPLPLGETVIGDVTCELILIEGHWPGQTALLLPDDDVAFVADTLSNIEVPSLDKTGAGAIPIYTATLDTLQTIIDRVAHIVPGHGAVADRAEAQQRLDADRRYLEALPRWAEKITPETDHETIAHAMLAELDEHRATEELSWDMHLRNLESLTPAS